MRFVSIAGLLIGLSACSRSSSDPVRDFSSRELTMPNGKTVLAEVMTNPTDVSRGMMFRDSLAPDRGVLLMYGTPGKYSCWTYQVKIPLDLIWMDQNRRVAEIAANTPPCQAKSANDCPYYGGHEAAQYVLELGAGMAAKYGIHVGSTIDL